MEVPLLINDFLRRAAKLYPDKMAIVDGDQRFTYREFQGRVNQLGHALRDSASSRATASASSARTRTSSSRRTTG